MNLHQMVRGPISAVNPDRPVLYRKSAGYTKTPDFRQVPAYVDYPDTIVQIQALAGKELEHIDGLNIQGVLKTIYMNGNTQGAVRPESKGGDLFVFDSQNWLVVHVLETWPDWCKVVICLQNP